MRHRRHLTPALGAAAILFLAGAAGRTALAEREFTGRITIVECRRLADGTWEVIDQFQGEGITFRASVVDLVKGKSFATPFVLSGSTANGRRFTISLPQPAKAAVDLVTGSVVLELGLTGTVDGATATVPLRLSTDETLVTPSGVVRGRRLSIVNGSSNTTVVGTTSVKSLERLTVLAGPEDARTFMAWADGSVRALP
jgi:hypothetical protein